jgi:hypothetical protein
MVLTGKSAALLMNCSIRHGQRLLQDVKFAYDLKKGKVPLYRFCEFYHLDLLISVKLLHTGGKL